MCVICEAIGEVGDEVITPDMALIRALALGFFSGEREGGEQVMKESLCLYHCHKLTEHQQWAKRMRGTERPWSEPEPSA